ncbi:MAG: segregation/condensation protein A [Anaerolineales bacterium]|jgi:segregation and condensation protein A
MTTVTEVPIQLPVYEGPLDLLLELIERAELDITKVALAQVTDQYLAYLKRAARYGLEDLTAFLVIATRLLQIKSEALLPRPPEREPDEEDPGDALARQLIAYKKYKQIAVLLSERESGGMRTYTRSAPAPSMEPQLDLDDLSVNALVEALAELISSRRPDAHLDEVVVAPKVKIRDRIAQIIKALRSRGKTTFRSVLSGSQTRLEIVVSFLAMLELIKLRRVSAVQTEIFGEIDLVPGETWDSDQELELELEFEE